MTTLADRTARRLGTALRTLALAAAVAVAAPFTTDSARAADAKAGAASAASTEWYQWRGPNRDGKSPEAGLLKAWPADGPRLAWRAAGIGAGFSSVSVVGGRIYTMGDDKGKDSSFVYALDAKDGKIVWSAPVGKPGGGGGYPGPRCTPTVDGDRVYAVGQQGDLVCLNAADGKEVWRKSLAKDFNGQMHSGWGFTESPLVDGDKLIVTPGGKDGTLAALDKKTGEPLWRTKDWTDAAAYTGAIVAEIGGQRQYIQFTAAHVGGVDAQTGIVLWKAERKGQTAVIPTPVYHDGIVYVTSGYGVGCDAFKVTPHGAKYDVEKLYSNKVMVNHHGGVILHEGHVYGFSDGKGWTCQNIKTGEAVWKQKEDAPGKGAIAYADGMFYLRDEGKGTVALIEATTKGYAEKGRFVQPDRSKAASWPHPVVAGGKLYLRDQDNLFCYDIEAK